MALQDLTPQLRTRMTRVERLAGLFVAVAALLMAVAFAYYIVDIGKRRGWFLNKVPYYCYVEDATGLRPGDPVRLLGREVGRIVQVEACPPNAWFINNHYNVFVKFEVREPYFGYIWTDSKVRLISADFFGARYLEVTRGSDELAYATVYPNPNLPFEETGILNDRDENYPNPKNLVKLRESKNGVWLFTEETPSIAKRAEQIVQNIAAALPALTNQISQVLDHASLSASNANLALTRIQPLLANLETITARIQSEDGAIGRMLLTTNLQTSVEGAVGSMNATLTNTTALIRTSETQLQDLTRRIALTLDNVALVTSNLSGQVTANSYVLGEVSSLVRDADDMVQGLKRHWLLRSAFQSATNPPIESIVRPNLDRVRPDAAKQP